MERLRDLDAAAMLQRFDASQIAMHGQFRVGVVR
jgi:hypothetical protein